MFGAEYQHAKGFLITNKGSDRVYYSIQSAVDDGVKLNIAILAAVKASAKMKIVLVDYIRQGFNFYYSAPAPIGYIGGTGKNSNLYAKYLVENAKLVENFESMITAINNKERKKSYDERLL